MVKEPLKPAVDAVAAFVGEELEELRRRDELEVVNSAKEVAVSRLECERRPVRAFGPSESRKTTTEGSLSLSGDRNWGFRLLRRVVRLGNGIESGLGGGFDAGCRYQR